MLEDKSLTWNKTACPYCGVGCGVIAGSKDGKVLKVQGDPEHPANYGNLCAKGATLPRILYSDDRIKHPLIRDSRQGEFRRASWEEALSLIARRWRSILKDQGPDALAFYLSGQLTTEAYYVANKLAKAFLGTNNIDSNSRLCMSSAVSGYTTSLGADAPPGSYVDLEYADVFVLIGTNTASNHPVVFDRIHQRKLRQKKHPEEPKIEVVVVDPRKTLTAGIADLYIPIRPGTDVAFLNGMLHVLEREGLINRSYIGQHTSGWEQLSALIGRYTPEKAADICGVAASEIRQAAMMFGKAKAAMSLWCVGLNQSSHGTAKINSLINLHLATGQIGRPGACPFSLTGQPNAMGGRETGSMSHILPGHRLVASDADRAECEALWEVPKGRISAKPGLPAVELFKAVRNGQVKSIWIIATNPLVSLPDLRTAEAAMKKAEFVVVSDAYHPTETTRMADVVLPAAQWSEMEGTVTNSDRTITHVQQCVDPPGEALPDWEIICRFARLMGFEKGFPHACAEDIFEEYKRFTAGRDLDIRGVSYARLNKAPLPWPCPDPKGPPSLWRFRDGKFAHPDGRAKFIAHEYLEPAESTSKQFPLILTTGRVRDQWHTMTRTGKIASLLKDEPEPFVEIHPDDALQAGLKNADTVRVHSRRGSATAKCRITYDIKSGTCFMPIHWGALRGDSVVNRVTIDSSDPVSREPEFKFCAVYIEKAELEEEEKASWL